MANGLLPEKPFKEVPNDVVMDGTRFRVVHVR
jgi:hypothetical protein